MTLAAKAGLIDAQLAARLSPSAAMRNVLVHVYLEVDYDRVTDAVPLTVEWYGEYVRQVAAWMREHEPGDSPALSRAIVPLSSPAPRDCAPYQALSCADRLSGYVSATDDRGTLPAGATSSTATRTGRHVIDLDPHWRVVIVLAALGVIPLLLALGWITRRVRDSYTRARDAYTELLLRSSYRRHRHRRTSTPAGPRLVPNARGHTGRHSRRKP